MFTHLSDAVAGVTLALTVTASSHALARIHGTVVAIDAPHGTFRIHHDPFPQMPMAMTMDVRPRHRSDLRSLRVGERVDAVVDFTTDPWLGSDIRPSSPRGTR
jgi:Cu/Ag efflux protein CusF